MTMEADCESGDANTEHRLPRELVIEILSRLPAHYLLQFRCVSKTWLRLLTLDPHFAQLHLDRSIQSNTLNPNPSILSMRNVENVSLYLATDWTSSDRAIKLQLPLHEGLNNYYTCFGVCNGLLCYSDYCYERVYVGNPSILSMQRGENIDLYFTTDCTSSGRLIKLKLPFHEGVNKWYACFGVCNGLLCYSDNCFKHVYVGNPLTKDYISISCPLPSICFPGLKNATRFAFGYDQASNNYKVIRAFCESDHEQFIFHSVVSVYTLGVDSSWRTLNEDFQYDLCTDIDRVPFVNGALHWFAWDNRHSLQAIVAFDMKNEVFQEIPSPSARHLDVADFDGIGELGGLLCMYRNAFHSEIWTMKEYGVVGLWAQAFKIREWQHYFDLTPLGFANNGELISMTNLDDLVLYNPETKSVKILRQQLSCVYTYIGSIISPRVISGVGRGLKED